ncbi:MAG TPA: serine/threonine-protein kinase [Polyangiaceae bacterium]|nr:serine/threonine-protein kinase [Polyangiaceae bacterium]
MNVLNSGSTLGHYELLVRLGRGGMASVWVARELLAEPGQQRLVALKAMLPELARYSDFRAMFLEEGLIVRSIEHQNVVRVYDVGEDGGILYMAMEWVEGDSLRAVMQETQRRGSIPYEIAARVIADAAAGLHAAHELSGWDGELRNVVHCDVSPHNLLLGLDGRTKVADFGVAHARLYSDFAESDKIKGKFGYMSPEQASGGKLDRRSDVFALGIVLYALTTGERLFRGDQPAHTLQLVKSQPITDPRRLRKDYPERLARIVLRALERDPARRFQTALAFEETLEDYLAQERVLVSQGSVSQFARRVLSARMDAVRQELRSALRVSGMPRAASEGERAALKVTATAPGTSSTHSAAAVPQTYGSPASKRRRALRPLIAATLGIVAASGSVLWLLNRPSPAQPSPPAPTLAADAPAVEELPGGQPADTAAAAVDIESLPVGAAASAARPAAPRPIWGRVSPPPAPPRPAPVTQPAPTPAPPGSDRAGVALPPELVQLEEQEPAPDANPALQPAPGTTPAAPAAGERGPFNRGAAMAQLGAAATRASSCKRPASPSGAGRAQVTFSPDGTPLKVSLSAPFAGTQAGSCVTASFTSARVPAFSGSSVTLPWTFRIPE